ncbi:hypothetical protein GCM10022240_15790 [Microbacterium kribbense]|uniref:Integral membrane protein n=1 Tax=Microbacterium kribbense TaxID=433645 RepID=A0ABP7GM61_9MICO
MHRLLVALLAAFDALIVAAVGVAVVLAPLTLLWVLGIGAPDWSALWPATGAVWQLGHLVPQAVHLPVEYLTVAGIPDGAAAFTLSVAPLALAGFTAIRAAQSGARAGRSGGWLTGVLSGTAVFAVIGAVIALTTRNTVVVSPLWQAILFPALVFAVPALIAAVACAWHEDTGILRPLREYLHDLPGGWPEVPALALRGGAIALTGLVAAGSLAVVVALLLRGGEVVALYQAGNLDGIGVIVVSLGQLAYLPTLVVWGIGFVAGPGFSVGVGTAVSPAGTQLGVVPGVPILGALPASTSPWLLVIVLLPIAAGAVAGWVLRQRMSELVGSQEYGVRSAVAVAVAACSAGGAALLAWLAGGSMGPDRLAEAGPHPGPVALAVGIEVLIGAAILLLGSQTPGAVSVVGRRERGAGDRVDAAPSAAPAAPTEDATDTVPIDPGLLRGTQP